MRPLINYYGAKWNLAPWILSHVPEHEVFIEVFGGSAAVLLQKHRSKVEVVNDIDEELVNLYMVVRDHGKELSLRCELTPYARIEYRRARQYSEDPIEQARRTIVKSFFGIGDALLKKNGFRMSISSNTNAAKTWVTYWQTMYEIVARFQGVLIESLDFEAIIKKYDSPTTCFFFDPPYVMQTRNKKHGYKHDFNQDDHDRLLSAISDLKGMSVLCGYDHRSYDKLLWTCLKKDMPTQKGYGRECLWLCPKVMAQEKQLSLIPSEPFRSPHP